MGRLAQVQVGEDPPLDPDKGRLALDHGAGGGASPRARKNFQIRIERQGQEARGWRKPEGVERTCSALLPRERNPEGERNEIL